MVATRTVPGTPAPSMCPVGNPTRFDPHLETPQPHHIPPSTAATQDTAEAAARRLPAEAGVDNSTPSLCSLLLCCRHDRDTLRCRDVAEHRLAPPIDVGPLAVPDAVLVRGDVDHVPTPLRRRQALVALLAVIMITRSYPSPSASCLAVSVLVPPSGPWASGVAHNLVADLSRMVYGEMGR